MTDGADTCRWSDQLLQALKPEIDRASSQRNGLTKDEVVEVLQETIFALLRRPSTPRDFEEAIAYFWVTFREYRLRCIEGRVRARSEEHAIKMHARTIEPTQASLFPIGTECRERQQTIRDQILQVPMSPQMRAVLLLRAAEEWTPSDVATALTIDRGNVDTLLSRAKAACRKSGCVDASDHKTSLHDVEDSYENRLRRHLATSGDSLPAQAAIVLIEIYGMTLSDTAEATSLPVSEVESILRNVEKILLSKRLSA